MGLSLRQRAMLALLLASAALLSCAVASETACGDEFESCVGGADPTSAEYTRCIPHTSVPTVAPPAFGRGGMLPLFALAPTYRNFNSGSFGNAPRSVIAQRNAWGELSLQRPDAWMRVGYKLVTRQVRRTWAEYVNADVNDLVLVENTSNGVNAILRSLSLSAGDSVLVLDTAYDQVVNVLDYLVGREAINLVTAAVQWPVVGEASYTRPVSAAIASAPGGSIKLCVFSHISSLPAVIVPIEALTAQCKAIGAMVLIDGAHAVGQIPVDINALADTGVDAYVANGHKWLYGAYGTAMLWLRPSLQASVMPSVLSSTSTPTANFTTEFEYAGTRDYAPWASLNATFNFRSWLGEERIIEYIKTLADQGATYLADLWGTEFGVPLSMSHAMTTVGLPTTSLALASGLQSALMSQMDMYVVPFERPAGVFWMRLSTQIYQDMSDYHALGQAVLDYFNLTDAGGRGRRWHDQRTVLHRHHLRTPTPTTATALV